MRPVSLLLDRHLRSDQFAKDSRFYCGSAIRVSTKHTLKMASVKFSILSNGSHVIDALSTVCHVPSTYQLIKMS